MVQKSTLSKTTNFGLLQSERYCRRQFKFDENGGKLSKRVENTVGKGEIARYEQYLLFPSKDLYSRHVKNQGLFGKGLSHTQGVSHVSY